jgi:hypothetical protein
MKASISMFDVVVGLLLATVPAIGSAQDSGGTGATGLLTPYGEYALIGGGATGFTKSPLKDRLDVGGAWDVRLGFASRTFVGAEVAYVGSVSPGKLSGPDLLANGAEGVVRVQYPWASAKWLVEPFTFGGIGWSHLALRNAPGGVGNDDDIGVVPFGGGVTIGYGRLLVDARFTYRTSFSEDKAFGATGAKPDYQRWAVDAFVGYEF